MRDGFTRRTLLRRGVLATLIGLAGCQEDSRRRDGPTGDGATATDTPTPTPRSTREKTANADGSNGSPTGDTSTDTRSTQKTESPETSGEDATTTRTDPGPGTETPTPGEGTTTDGSDGTPAQGPTPTPQTHRVEVGPAGSFQFVPASLTLSAGDVVEWVWRSDGHNVRPSSTPSGSTWSGTPGGDDTTYDEGYTYTHQFTVVGQYDYYCAPHRSLGMTGELTVE